MTARIERLVTSGTFSLDGDNWEVDNNVWIVGDDHEVIVIDAALPQGLRQAPSSGGPPSPTPSPKPSATDV